MPSWPSPSANCQNQTSEKKTFEASLLIMCLAYACGPSNASAHMWPCRHACGHKDLPVCVAIMPADITHALDRPSPTPAPGPPLSAETLSEARGQWPSPSDKQHATNNMHQQASDNKQATTCQQQQASDNKQQQHRQQARIPSNNKQRATDNMYSQQQPTTCNQQCASHNLQATRRRGTSNKQPTTCKR